MNTNAQNWGKTRESPTHISYNHGRKIGREAKKKKGENAPWGTEILKGGPENLGESVETRGRISSHTKHGRGKKVHRVGNLRNRQKGVRTGVFGKGGKCRGLEEKTISKLRKNLAKKSESLCIKKA